MKRNLILAFAAFALTILVVGCGSLSTGNEEADKALDALKLDEKAPTLGPVYRLLMVKVFKDDYEGCWDMIAKEIQDGFGKMRDATVARMSKRMSKMEKEDIDNEIADMRKNLEAATDDKEKAGLEAQIKLLEYAKDDFKALPDAKSFFVYSMKQALVKKQMLDEIKKRTVIKEEIADDGKSGYILFDEDGNENKIKFVKENGEWKMAMGEYTESAN